MKVLHVIVGLGRDSGGSSRSSQWLVMAFRKAGSVAWIHSFDRAEPWISGVRDTRGIRDWGLHKEAVMCRKAGVPYVSAQMGMLEPWAMVLKEKGKVKKCGLASLFIW